MIVFLYNNKAKPFTKISAVIFRISRICKHCDIALPENSTYLWSHYRAGVAQRVGTGIALLFHDRGTRSGWVVSSTPQPHLTPGKTQYPFYRRLGESQGRSGRTENLVPTGIRSRTIQPVVQSLYRLSYPVHRHIYRLNIFPISIYKIL